MARYDFSRLSVLVVEDSRFMRSLLVTTLRALGVERVSTAENGQEAIQFMAPAAAIQGESLVGKTGIDMIISDYVMPVVDGGMLLRWIRLAGKSPDRFMPFLMVSAAADKEVLFACRDAGVDEFMAKPFSAEGLAKRITSVVEHPRPYIYCPNYFGPERRRQSKPFETERRKTTDDEIETLYSGKDMSKMKNKKKRVWIFKLPKSLKQKLATGTAKDSNEPPFDPELLKAAEDKIQNMATDYSDWVKESIEELQQAHHRAVEDPDQASEQFATIHTLALELRGQGGIFGYPLISQFGKSLYDITNEHATITPQLLDLVDSHIDLVKVVINQKVAGDGGETGRQLLQSLAEAKRKFADS
jgi:CheY-like chemotaxis protein